MSYSWQLAQFPVAAGEEITWKHFETIRRRVYAMRFLQIGMLTYPYGSPITSATWEAWVDANFSDLDFVQSMDYRNGAWTRLLNLVFLSTSGMASSDLFSNCITSPGYANKAALKADPPCNSSGVISGNWCYAADPSIYRDFDRYSGRYIVKTYTAGTGVSYLSKAEAWRYLPIQVGPQHQRPHIKYTDTGRIIPHILPLERNWQHLSQPSTMGPNFDVIGEYDDGGHFRETKQPYDGDNARSIPLNGYEYALILLNADVAQTAGSSPSDAMPSEWVDEDQMYFDPKFCAAYQNQIEHLVSTFNWTLKIDPGTAWGAVWINNYNQTLFHTVPAWPEYESYLGYYYRTKSGGGVWTKPGGTLNEPSYENGWSREDYGYDHVYAEPTIISAESEYWGCNRSAFELALYILGSFDWYYTASHKFSPRELVKAREDLRHLAGYPTNPTDEQIQSWYPLSAGTWRRTWRYTFGRPKWSASMMPGESTPTNYLYTDFQAEGAGGLFWWPGIFTPSGYAPGPESEYLNSGDIADIHTRHDSVATGTRAKYEQVSLMLNDLWSVLGIMSMSYIPCSLGIEIRTGSATVSSKSSSSLAYSDARTGALADILTKSFATPGGDPTTSALGSASYLGTSGVPAVWGGNFSTYESRFSIAPENFGGTTIEQLQGQTLYGIVLVKPFYDTDVYENPTPPYPHGIAVCDKVVFESLTNEVPNWDMTYATANRPSTGVPDGFPEKWQYWGGEYNSLNIHGRVCIVPLALDELTWDSVSGSWKIPITIESDVPESIGDYSTDCYIDTFGRVSITVLNTSGGLAVALDLEDSRIDWSTARYTTYTSVAVDDEKFDNNGLLS